MEEKNKVRKGNEDKEIEFNEFVELQSFLLHFP